MRPIYSGVLFYFLGAGKNKKIPSIDATWNEQNNIIYPGIQLYFIIL